MDDLPGRPGVGDGDSDWYQSGSRRLGVGEFQETDPLELEDDMDG